MITIGLPEVGIVKIIFKRNRQFNQNGTMFPVVPEDNIWSLISGGYVWGECVLKSW
jgi:hypothetical protein